MDHCTDRYSRCRCLHSNFSGCSAQPASDVGAAKPYINMPGSNAPSSPNCYAYAIGSPFNGQPGRASGRFPTKWNDVNDVGESVKADLEAMGRTVRKISGPDANVYDNEFKIALRVGTRPYKYNLAAGQVYYDYHLCGRLIPDNGRKNMGMAGRRSFGVQE